MKDENQLPKINCSLEDVGSAWFVGAADEFGAARNAYQEQIEFGNAPKSALDLAIIVYQQRNPRVPVSEARNRIAQALGIQET